MKTDITVVDVAEFVRLLQVKAYEQDKWVDWETGKLTDTSPQPKIRYEQGDNDPASPEQAWA